MLMESVSLKEPAGDNETFAHKLFTLTGTPIPPIKRAFQNQRYPCVLSAFPLSMQESTNRTAR